MSPRNTRFRQPVYLLDLPAKQSDVWYEGSDTMQTTVIPAYKSTMPKQIRVAAYARVSSSKDAMLHSLSAQVSYYSSYIQRNPLWKYAGVYADEAVTGTKDSRANFQRMLTDARDGKLDLILTKSVSRFARNTLTLLNTVRELTSLNVDVYFEEQNIHTNCSEGEVILTILSSYAQAESLSASENQKWRVRKDFKAGKVPSLTILGYRRLPDASLAIVPEEAEIVKRIYSLFLNGLGKEAIANKLNNEHVPTRTSGEWSPNGIHYILTNEKYTGLLLLQKTCSKDHLTKQKIKNTHFPKYEVQNNHEAIIDKDTFSAVQDELKRRAKRYASGRSTLSPFTGKITCAYCGKHYKRRNYSSDETGHAWVCSTYARRGKAFCPHSRVIPESELLKLKDFKEIII